MKITSIKKYIFNGLKNDNFYVWFWSDMTWTHFLTIYNQVTLQKFINRYVFKLIESSCISYLPFNSLRNVLFDWRHLRKVILHHIYSSKHHMIICWRIHERNTNAWDWNAMPESRHHGENMVHSPVSSTPCN